MLPLPYRL